MQRRIDHRQRRIQHERGHQFRPLQQFHHRGRQRQAGRFDQHVIDAGAARGNRQHGRDEVRIVAIRDQAVREVVDTDVIMPGGNIAQQRAIDRHFAEFVDQQRQPPALTALDQAAQQRGFSGAEKAGDDGDRYRLHHSHRRSCARTASKLDTTSGYSIGGRCTTSIGMPSAAAASALA
jgi:hypothetical protein